MWNDLNTLSAKELKVIAESMWLVKWEDFKANASKDDMLELIENQSNDDNSNDTPKEVITETIKEDTVEENHCVEYAVVTHVKRNGKLLKKWDSIDYFDGIETLVAEWVVETC